MKENIDDVDNSVADDDKRMMLLSLHCNRKKDNQRNMVEDCEPCSESIRIKCCGSRECINVPQQNNEYKLDKGNYFKFAKKEKSDCRMQKIE